MMTTEQRALILAIASAITEAVNECPEGLPSGHLYAMLMEHGCSLAQYENLVGTLVGLGKIRKRGHLLLPA